MQDSANTAENAAQIQRSVALSPEDFWRLRALIRDVEAIELEFAKMRSELETRIREAMNRRDKALAEIGQKYGMPGPGRYTFDDATCSLVSD
jgi:hypothetical protein